MLEILSTSEHVVALRVSGHVDRTGIERGITAVEDALARQERIALYVEIGMSGAFARDLGYGLRHVRELRRFARIAVVTEREWVRRIVQVQGRVLPQIGIRIFTPGERSEALTWVAQPITSGEPEIAQAPPAVRLIETARPDVIAFEVSGRIRRDDMHLLFRAFEQALGAHERLRVLVLIMNFDGVTLEALREEGLASVKMRGWRQVERYALGSGPAWMAMMTGWAAPVARTETCHFKLAREDEAWRWLGAEPRISDPA